MALRVVYYLFTKQKKGYRTAIPTKYGEDYREYAKICIFTL